MEIVLELVWFEWNAKQWRGWIVCRCVCVCEDKTYNDEKKEEMAKHNMQEAARWRRTFSPASLLFLLFLVYFTLLVMNDYILCKTIKTWNSTRGIIFVWES